MRRRVLLTATAIAVAGCGQTPAVSESDDSGDTTDPKSSSDSDSDGDSDSDSNPPDPERVAELVHQRVNDERTERSRGEVYDDRFLADPARDHSIDMDKRDFYAHENPSYEQPWDRVECDAAEVLHRGEIGELRQPDGEQVYDTSNAEEMAAFIVDGWLQSEGHRQVILDSVFDRAGVGIHINDGQFWATMMFCEAE